jgi:type VI secretion system ImpA family protein
MLQLNELLDPISESSPAGHDLTFSSDVDAIHKARLFDDPSLDQGEWVVALKEADWEFVYAKCSSLLATQTKDLRIAGWLVEAAAKTLQFEGLAAGFELLTGMCDRYWDVLYPLPDGSDVEQRVGNVTWLLSRSVQLVKEIPLTEGRETAFSWTDFEAARARANNAALTKTVTSQTWRQWNPHVARAPGIFTKRLLRAPPTASRRWPGWSARWIHVWASTDPALHRSRKYWKQSLARLSVLVPT